MTKEQLNKLLTAQAEGKTVQTLMVNGEWRDVFVSELDLKCDISFYRIKPEENYTIEQNAGENKVEGGVVSISGSTKVYTCKDCLRHPFCYLAKERNGEACMKISLYEETEKHYRPFNDCSELIECYQRKYKSTVGCDIYFPSLYKPCIWVKSKMYGTDNLITAFDVDNESIGGSCVFIQDIWIDMKELFDNFTFLDGSPCGNEEQK